MDGDQATPPAPPSGLTATAGGRSCRRPQAFCRLFSDLARLADQELRRQLHADDQRAQAMLEKVRQFHRFQLDLSEGNRIVRFFTRLPVIQEPDGAYKFSELVTREFTQLMTHGDLSVIVLLPRPAQGYDVPPLYNVQLLRREPADAQVFGEGQLPAPAQRMAVTWYWRHDPLLTVRYQYA